MRTWRRAIVSVLVMLVTTAGTVLAAGLEPAAVANQMYEPHVGGQLPLQLRFTDENGAPVTLRMYFDQNRPVLLSLNYFQCQYLCPIETDGIVSGLNGTKAALGQDLTLLTVSIDPHDGPGDAAVFKARGLRGYDRPGGADGWHLLTTDEATIGQLTAAVGFHFLHDADQADYAHPVGLVVLTPNGTISDYLYGIDFDSTQIQSALDAARQDQPGTWFDRAALICYEFDPLTGRYTALALNLLRIGGAVTLLAVVLFLGRLWRAELRGGRA